MMGWNHVSITGRLGGDAELRYTPNQTPVAKFSLAYTEKRADAYETQWFNVTLWGKYAETMAPKLKKGCGIAVSGSLRSNQWTDKNNQKKSTTEINAQSIEILVPKEKSQDQQGPTEPKFTEDDVPF